ncbi:MAG: DUF2235 domain-containing protein, partial [Fimbriimonadaceae bacterium]|nr:DUF2235 domain-containing protein [Alphaproteobacteria bacterium]
AYRSVRKYSNSAPIARLFRWLRDRLFLNTPTREEFRKTYSVSPRPRIAFVGVFETVSAYGLPIDEMTIAVHKWIFPLRFANMILSRKVDHACQALALDEKRHSFHPVLWTERTFDRDGGEGEIDTRPLQAWFPGMHSDVGGGYGDDRLSLVPAVWMLEEVQRRLGLRLHTDAFAVLDSQASELGVMHNSRSGFGVFYRYKPRILAVLGDEDLDGNGYAEVRIDRFKIHQSTFERIRATGADYAPLGIPENYDVVRRNTNPDAEQAHEIVPASLAGYETDDQRARRARVQRNLGDLIFWRRTLYFVMVAIALAAIVIPLLWRANPGAITHGTASSIVGSIAWIASYVPLPKMTQIGQFWTQNPNWFLGGLGVFVFTYLISEALARAIHDGAQSAWAHVAGKPVKPVRPQWQWIETWRANSAVFSKYWTKKALPLLTVLFLFLALPLIAVWRWYLFVPVHFDSVCSAVHENREAVPARPLDKPFAFNTTDPCLNSGIELKEGRDYGITITVTSPWIDGIERGLPADPAGLRWSEISWTRRALMSAASLMRRYWTDGWFATMGSIGRARDHAFRINVARVASGSTTYSGTFHAWRSGRLHLFVNDGINPFSNGFMCPQKDRRPYWRCYYDNNRGTADITVREIGER